jgi:hypothetical protein
MTRTATALLLLLAMLAAPPAQAQTSAAEAVPEEFGPWRLLCTTDRMTDATSCQLRHRTPVEQGTGTTPSLVLEVEDRQGHLVPVIAARELTLEAAGRGLLALTGTAQLRFPPNRLLELPCGLEGRSLVCAPRPEDAPRAAEELLAANRALVRMAGFGGGAASGAEPVELQLDRTRDALARLRARMPEGSGSAAAAGPGLSLMDILDRLRRFFGQ